MKPIKFRAVFEPSIDGYWVYFPELPGCISWGENIEKAREGAREALSLHLYGILKDGEEIECAKEKFQIDPETADGFLVSTITIDLDMVLKEFGD